ncbi:MAG: endonuclease III [Neisseriaceae bacterium]|nr:MAG: endonuclease III [Neisseriaceae bacterium]
MNQAKRIDILKRFKEADPSPQTELIYSSAYELLVAVILSAQATDISVNKATNNLFQVACTPQEMLDLGEEMLIDYIKSIGLYKNKAKNIIRCSQQLLSNFNGEVPRNREDLESLAGVGRKTANVVLNTLYDEPVVAVDTHVFRVANRTGIAKGRTVLEVEKKLEKNIPKSYLNNVHHWLVLHGRYVCKARNPLCCGCIINDLCDYSIYK